MTISTFTSWQTKKAAPWMRLPFCKDDITNPDAGRKYSLWPSAPFAGSAPTTAAACDDTLTGALKDFTNGTAMRLAQILVSCESMVTVTLCDRLSHQGGLSGTAAGAQTTNLPTAALTRYATGAGVKAALEIYSQVGSTARTATTGYTNSAGTAARTSLGVEIGGTDHRNAQRFIPISLQAGDSGVRSVESVTLSASTGTAGNFGVTLYKPLFSFHYVGDSSRTSVFDTFMQTMGPPEILSGACLFWTISQSRALSVAEGTGLVQGEVVVIEE